VVFKWRGRYSTESLLAAKPEKPGRVLPKADTGFAGFGQGGFAH